MSLESYINQADAYIAELLATIAKRDDAIAQLRVQVAQLSEKLNAVPVDAIYRYIDNSDPNFRYGESAEGDADIYLIRNWLEGNA